MSGEWNANGDYYFGAIGLQTVDCEDGASLDYTTGLCANNTQKGNPRDPLFCSSPSSMVGNPINAATGNKYQEEIDVSVGAVHPIIVSRSYNSQDGLWRHSYSTSLYFGATAVVLVQADGREAIFTPLNGIYTSKNDSGALVKVGEDWVYQSPTDVKFHFSSKGQLTSILSLDGNTQTLSYQDESQNRGITVRNQLGDQVQLTEDALHQLRALASIQASINYVYELGHISKAQKTAGGTTVTRQYLYEDTRNTKWLTGIIDERGIRFATWAYDAKGRAISSQHSDGVGLTQVAYNTDGSSTVTNELGKQVTYRYQQISGVNRISSIVGQPSLNCSASNSSYTYNDRGQVLTKTDAQGIVTAYTYNDRGLEISRTEASGTSLAKITTTEWDPVRFLRTQVVEPTRTTLYTYDDQGRQLGQQIIVN